MERISNRVCGKEKGGDEKKIFTICATHKAIGDSSYRMKRRGDETFLRSQKEITTKAKSFNRFKSELQGNIPW